MAAAVLAPVPANKSAANPFFISSHQRITIKSSQVSSSFRSSMPAPSPVKPTKPQRQQPESPEPPQRTLHRLRSSLEQSIRFPTRASKSKSPATPVADHEPATVSNKSKAKSRDTPSDVTKETKDTKEKEKPGVLRRIESKVTFRKATVSPAPSTSPVPSSVSKTKERRKHSVDRGDALGSSSTSFVRPILQQGTMSSPALHHVSQAIPSPRSRPAAVASSSSVTDVLVSPGRERRISIQISPRDNSSPKPRRSSKDYARTSDSPLVSPSTPSFSTTLRANGHAPETPSKVREPISPPDTPTPASHRRRLSTISSQRMAASSSGHLPLGSPPGSPTTPTAMRTRSPSRTRVVTPTTPRGLASTSTTNLPSTRMNASSPTPRRTSLEHRRGSNSSPPRTMTPTSVRPRAASPGSPSYMHTRHPNLSTASLCAPSTSEQRELVRSAVSILCKELLKPPPHLSRTETGPREWEEIEVRMRALQRSQRIWGKSGGVASGSSSQLSAPGLLGSSGLGTSAEERERKLFSEALRDGYVLCQLLNKLCSAAVTRPDPREDGFIRTSNVTKFLAACSSYGVPSNDLFLRDDLIESTPESLARAAGTVIALIRHVSAPPLDRSKYLRGHGKKSINPNPESPGADATGFYTHGRSRAAASTPNLSLDPTQRATSPTTPIRKKGTPSPDLPTLRSDSPGDDGSGGQTVRDNRGLGLAIPGNDRDMAINGVPRILSPPPRSPLRARSPPVRAEEANGTAMSSSLLNVATTPEQSPTADSPRPPMGDSVRVSIADPRKAARQSVASSNMTDTTAFSSVFDVRQHSGGAANKFGTIRTVTTEQTEPPSLTRTEGSQIVAALHDEKGRMRGTEAHSRERNPIAEETEDGVRHASSALAGKESEREREARRVENVTAIRLGKGKWPDDFMDAFQSRPIPIKQPAPTNREEAYPTPTSITPPSISISGPRKLAIVGRRNESVESLPQFPRRPTHRARHSIDTASSLAPKEPGIHDSSLDGLPSARVMLRRNSSKQSAYRNGVYIPRSLDDPRSNDDMSTDSLVPFPRALSGDHTGRLPSPAPSDLRHRSESPANAGYNDRPRLPRGRFQSEVDGASSRTRGRPNSYDELGAKPARRLRYESMVNLGVASGHISASDYMSKDSLDGSAVRKTIVIKEEGKPPTRFQLGNCIGRGQFGSVYRALNLNTGQTVAVKCIRLEGLKEEEVTQLMREVDLVKSLSHPSIVKYEGMARDEDTLSIVLEYAENGSLGQTLKAFGRLNERLVAGYVVKILEGLHYLHQSEVVHCDLKAANILTTKNGNVKLSDFGVSLNLRTVGRERENVAGTPNWMAPEVIELKGASPKSDIWSLACTVIELLTGRPPYAEIANGMSVMFQIVENDIPPIPEECSELLRDFLKLCFNKDPSKRPSAERLCEHPWLKKNWGAHKELRPQDSIPFLRRVSADLQKNDFVRYLSQFEIPAESPVSENFMRHDDFINGSPPNARRLSNALAPPRLHNDNDGSSPREHTFVKTTFSKPMICKVCLVNVKKSAVLCDHCNLIAHSKCAKDAPPTCDLRAQLLQFARYAEQGNPASVYSNPAHNANEARHAPPPAVPMSDVVYVSHDSRTSDDASQQPPPPPLKAKAASQPISASNKFIPPFFKRSRATSPEPVQAAAPAAPIARHLPSISAPSAPSDLDEGKPSRKPTVLRRTRERPLSLASSGATPNSLRSMVTAAESISATGRSDAGTRTSASRFSVIEDSEGRHSMVFTGTREASVEGDSGRRSTVPGGLPKDDNRSQTKKHHSKSSGSSCTVQ